MRWSEVDLKISMRAASHGILRIGVLTPKVVPTKNEVDTMQGAKRSTRRSHAVELKKAVLNECRAGVSVAGVGRDDLAAVGLSGLVRHGRSRRNPL